MSLTEALLTESAGMRGLEAGSNRVREDYVATTGAFTPASLPGLFGWYDAQDASSFTYSSGSVVSQWADKSGGAHHLANTDPSTQPSRSTTGLNGHPALVSAMKALQYKGSNLVTGTTMSFAIIYRFNSGNRILSFNSSTGLDHEVLGGELGGPYPQWSRQPASDVYGPDITGAIHTIFVVNDGATSTMYLDGAVTGTPAAQTSTFDIDQINLGVNMYTWDNGDIIVGEVIITSAAFTPTNRSDLLAYLQARWAASPWSDTTFTKVNSGGDYSSVSSASGGTGAAWAYVSGSSGPIRENYGFATCYSLRHDAAATKNQYVKITVPELDSPWSLIVRGPAVADWNANPNPGYFFRHSGGPYYDFYVNSVQYPASTGGANPTGPGTVELRCIANVCTVYINGALFTTMDMSAHAVTTNDAHQGFGSRDAGVVNAAEGGDWPPAPPFNIPWAAMFWAEDPAVTAPADGAVIPATWNQPGSYATTWTRVQSPTFVANWKNGKPAVNFPGTGGSTQHRLTTTFAATNQAQVTVAIIGETTSSESDLMDGIDSSADRLVLDRTGGQWRMYRGSNVVSTTSDGLPHLFIARYFNDGADTLTVDGVVKIGPTSVGVANAGKTIALGSTLNNQDHAGSKVAFVGLVTGELTTQQRADLLAWYQSYYIAPTLYSDNFNRADGAMGSEWLLDTRGGPNWVIANQVARHVSNTNDFAMFLHDLGSNDHWVEATIFGFSQTFVNARRIVTDTIGNNCYYGGVSGFNGKLIIGRCVANNRTELVTTADNAYPSFNGKIRLEVQGTAIRLYADGVLALSTTDSSITTGTYAGIHADNWVQDLDEFRCGPLPWPGSAIPASYSDNFNRADSGEIGGGVGGVGLGPDWIGSRWKIVSNVAQNGGGDDFATYRHTTGTRDHWSEMTVVYGPGNSIYNVLNARDNGSNDHKCYMFFIRPDSNQATLGKTTGSGGYSDLNPYIAISDHNNGHKLRIECEGTSPTTIRAYIDDVLVATRTDTDADLNGPQNTYCGMNAGDGARNDNYRCGPLPYTPP